MIPKYLWQPIYTVFALLTFALSVLVAFPLFVLIGLAGGNRSRKLIWLIIRYWAKAWLFLIGMPVRISGPRPPEGKYVIVANHVSYLDAIMIFAAIPAYFRPLGKSEMSAIPVMGFIYRQIVLPVDRSSKHSRARSMRLMYRTLRTEANVLIFPEGTFNETEAPLKEFYDGAFRLAINAGVPVFPMLFPDSHRRWHYSAWWKSSPGRNRVVYLDPIPVSGMETGDITKLRQQVFEKMQAEMIRLNPGEYVVRHDVMNSV